MPRSQGKDLETPIVLWSFFLLTIWWFILQVTVEEGSHASYIFGAVYGPFMSLFGGIVGLRSAKLWGGWKSLMGKAVVLLSFGLLAQAFGQVSNSMYNLALGIEVSYPGVPDIGFFGSIPLYIAAVVLLIQATGGMVRMRSKGAKIEALVIPVIGLLASYLIFLQGYAFDWTMPLTIFFDFGYPLGQALYVSLALLAYSLSRGMLGGIMRKPILFLLVALVAQYFSDFSFLYANSHDGYFVGGFVDYIYLVAYTIMALV
jgi:hypothetical protein